MANIAVGLQTAPLSKFDQGLHSCAGLSARIQEKERIGHNGVKLRISGFENISVRNVMMMIV